MSQPLPPDAGVADDPGPPLKSEDELIAYFTSAEKTRDRFRVGTEHEKFGFTRLGHRPLPYEGDNGIEAILNAIANDDDEKRTGTWVPARDGGRVIALFRDDASITLEPGGQLELSGAPLRTVHETFTETAKHLALLKRVCIPRGVGFVGLGFHPTATWSELPLVPKSRYAVMTKYMPRVGTRGLDMMKRTCTVQANYDWENEADMIASFQMALAVSPLATALFANSPFLEGRPSGALSERARVWGDVDKTRCGFPAPVLEPGFGYQKWLDWCLDVPMYFIRRDGVHHDVAGASFRSFMKNGLNGIQATLRDFGDHLTTLFPEVRLKRVLEVRGADCGPLANIAALPALYKGLLYDVTARDAAWTLMDGPTADELTRLHQDIAVRGYQARYRDRLVLELCEELVDIASAGLVRIGDKDWKGEDESKYLKPLVQALEEGTTFAERLLKKYRTDWNGSLDPMWQDIELFSDRADIDPGE
jgi:glutamate--cysteine ligase